MLKKRKAFPISDFQLAKMNVIQIVVKWMAFKVNYNFRVMDDRSL